MSNPSTVWASLSLPLSPVGSIPFVSTDQATIVTDVGKFKYTPGGVALNGDGDEWYQLFVQNGLRFGYQSNVSIASDVTMNIISGRIRIPSGDASKTVINELCVQSSIVLLQLESLDATLTQVIAECSPGYFTIAGNAAASSPVNVSWIIFNTLLLS